MKTFRVLTLFLAVWMQFCSIGFSQEPTNHIRTETIVVSGRVIDGDGNSVANSMVIPFTADDGWLLNKSATPLEVPDQVDPDKQSILLAVTDPKGYFKFDLPPGTYRFVAQSWIGNSEVKKLLDVNGAEIRLDGVIESYTVKTSQDEPDQNEPEANDEEENSALPTALTIKPVGTAAILLDLDIGNDDTLILVSRKPLAADPILGFAAWSGDFWKGVIGGNRMPDGQTTISGLPSGKLHVTLFANDNNPGFGAVSIELHDGETISVELPIVASWSDGHKLPPERLEQLTDYFRDNSDEGVRVQEWMMARIKGMDEEITDPSEYFKRIVPLLDEPIKLKDGSKIPFCDAIAAIAYARLSPKE